MKLFLRLFLFIALSLTCNPVFAQPTADFSANIVTGCAPLIVQFTNLSTGAPTSYNWDFGNSSGSVLQNPSTTYTNPGTYTVTLTVSNGSGSNTKTITNYITVYGPPIVNFTVNDTAGCPPHAVQFTSTSNPVTPGPAQFNWSFGDGNSSTLENPAHTYQLPGYYNVTLIVTNSGGCTKSLTKSSYIHVYDPPTPDFTAPTTSFCDIPGTVNFTSTTTGSAPFTYYWEYGDGGTGTGNSPSHTYTTSGTYSVTLVATDNKGCKDTIVKPGFVSLGTLTGAFTLPASACIGSVVSFTNTSSGASGFNWNFAGLGTSPLQNPSFIFNTAGTYNIRLIASNGSCSDTVIHPITIHPAPTIDFTSSPVDPCPAPQVIQFTNNTSGGSTYTWLFGDGGQSTAANPSHLYNLNGLYDVTLIATSGNGCKDTLTKPQQVKIYDLILDAGADTYSGCFPLEVFCASSTFTSFPGQGNPYPYNTTSWSWDFGDGGTSTQDTVTHIFQLPGTYTVSLTITTANGCTRTDTFQILVGTLPTAAFTASPDTICSNELVEFDNNSIGGTIYTWDFGDGGSTTAQNPIYEYITAGTYTVVLHAYNNGCEDTFKVENMITVHPPTSIFKIKYDCDTPTLVKFSDSSIAPSTWQWDFGDGGSTFTQHPEHNFPGLGTYNVRLITTNNTYGCIDTAIIPVNLINPVVQIINDTAICNLDTVNLSSTFSGIAIRYDWTIGLTGFPDTTSNMDFGFLTPGVIPLILMARDLHECDHFDTSYVRVGNPDANFIASPVVGCVPMQVQFTDISTDVPGASMTTRAWDFGNGSMPILTTGTANTIYNTPGVFNVRLAVTDNIGCVDTVVKTAYIEARKPDAIFTVNDTSACIGQVLNFNNTSVGNFLSAEWNFGDGQTSVDFNASHAYQNTGYYTVRLIVTDPTGCKDTLIRNNYVHITKPDAAFTMSDTFSVCPPLQVFFTNTTVGGLSYAWNFGDGNTATITNPDNAYSTSDLFTIRLIATNNQGCKDTAFGTVNILGYGGGLSYTPLEGCVPMTVAFTANLTNVPSIVWDFSDGVTAPATGTTTTHTYTTPGAYVPKLILSDGAGCLSSSEGLDTIKVDGILGGFTVTPPCVFTNVQFQDTSLGLFSPVVSWAWSFNNGQQTSSSQNPTNYYNAPGTYPVSLIVTNAHGCIDTVNTDITIHPLPIISAGTDTVICVSDAAQLLGTGGVSYVWTPALNLSCTNCPDPLASPPVPTNYIVTGTDINGCANKDTVLVDLQFQTTSVVGEGGAICDDSTFQLMASGAHRYEWRPAESLNDAFIPNPLASPHTTTTYTVKAWEGSCPPDSHTVVVIVYPLPTVDAGSDQTIIAGASVMLNATGTLAQQYVWSPYVNLSCETCSNPMASPLATTTYKVTAYTDRGCRKTDSVTVRVLCDQSQLFIPNSFTPNSDGQNDVFYPRGQGLQTINAFRIYSRWGELIFERRNISLNDESNAWDGTHKGKELSPDIFVYVVEATCDSGEPITWKGDISLIR